MRLRAASQHLAAADKPCAMLTVAPALTAQAAVQRCRPHPQSCPGRGRSGTSVCRPPASLLLLSTRRESCTHGEQVCFLPCCHQGSPMGLGSMHCVVHPELCQLPPKLVALEAPWLSSSKPAVDQEACMRHLDLPLCLLCVCACRKVGPAGTWRHLQAHSGASGEAAEAPRRAAGGRLSSTRTAQPCFSSGPPHHTHPKETSLEAAPKRHQADRSPCWQAPGTCPRNVVAACAACLCWYCCWDCMQVCCCAESMLVLTAQHIPRMMQQQQHHTHSLSGTMPSGQQHAPSPRPKQKKAQHTAQQQTPTVLASAAEASSRASTSSKHGRRSRQQQEQASASAHAAAAPPGSSSTVAEQALGEMSGVDWEDVEEQGPFFCPAPKPDSRPSSSRRRSTAGADPEYAAPSPRGHLGRAGSSSSAGSGSTASGSSPQQQRHTRMDKGFRRLLKRLLTGFMADSSQREMTFPASLSAADRWGCWGVGAWRLMQVLHQMRCRKFACVL